MSPEDIPAKSSRWIKEMSAEWGKKSLEAMGGAGEGEGGGIWSGVASGDGWDGTGLASRGDLVVQRLSGGGGMDGEEMGDGGTVAADWSATSGA